MSLKPNLLLLLLLSTTTTITSTTTTTLATASLHCKPTLFPSLCISTLLSIPNLVPSTPLPSIISHTINTTFPSITSSSQNFSSILPLLAPRQQLPLSDCIDLLDSTQDHLHLSLSIIRKNCRCIPELSTLLSAAITNQFTCLDGFADGGGGEGEVSVRPQIRRRIVRIYRRVSNALALSKKIGGGGDDGFGGGEFWLWMMFWLIDYGRFLGG